MGQRIAALVILFATWGSFAETPKGPNILLYDPEKKDGVLFSGPLLPHRVYIQYQPSLKGWFLVETDVDAKLAKYPTVLQPNSVVPALYFGIRDPQKNFKLRADGIWTVTQEAENHILLELGPNPVLRSVKYRPVSSSKVKLASGN